MKSEQLESAIRQFVYAIRENPKFKAEALAFIKAVEKDFNALENEINQFHKTIAGLLQDEKLYLDILQMYGVNLNKLGTTSIEKLKWETQWAKESGYIHIPERLVPYVSIKDSEMGKAEDYQWI